VALMRHLMSMCTIGGVDRSVGAEETAEQGCPAGGVCAIFLEKPYFGCFDPCPVG
jgi:hypothetical protein